MVCHLSVGNPYPIDIGLSVIGAGRENPLMATEYVDPGGVDHRARQPFAVQMVQGYPVVPASVPRRLHWKGGRRIIPELLALAGVPVVCERFRDLVERFEPGRHQLLPVAIHRDPRAEPAATYYWLNICTRLDSVDPKHTTFLRKPGHEGSFYWSDMSGSGSELQTVPGLRLMFSEARAAGRHLWVDPHLPAQGHWLCSEAFAAAARAGNFSALNVTSRPTA